MIIFSIIAVFMIIISLCIKERKKSLYVQSMSCIFESLYSFSINATTGGFLGIFNFIRSLIFCRGEKINKIIYKMFLILFETIIVINCFYTWAGPISFWPTIASFIRTYCLWQTKYMRLVRISGIITGIFNSIYFIYYNSAIMALGYILLIVAGIINFFKYDVKIVIKEEQLKA